MVVVFGDGLMIFPVKVFRPTKKGMQLIRTYTIEQLKDRHDEKMEKMYIHPTVKRMTRKELESERKNNV